MKKHIIFGILLTAIGCIGFLICLVSGNIIDQGHAYTKNWSISNKSLQNLTIRSDYNIDVNFKKTTSDQNYITLNGNLTPKQIEKLNDTVLSKGNLTIDMKHSNPTLNKINLQDFGIQDITIHLASDFQFDNVVIESDTGKIDVNNLTSKHLKVAVQSGFVEGYKNDIQDATVRTKSADVELLHWLGNVTIHNDEGTAIIKDSIGDFQIISQSGIVQSHRNIGEAILLKTDTGKIVSTEDDVTTLNINTKAGVAILEEVDGKLAATAGTGKIVLRNIRGDLTATTDDADIILDQQTVAGNITAVSKSGLVKMTLSPLFKSAPITTQTSTGEVFTPKTFSARQGSPKINIKTDSGDIKIFSEE
ncbi:DUF4097 family beta strand repeat-containing protein [Listeria booriae]|uniref:DUF4097 domain-containing protein n=1 Tax=Listeria booriae TaxID=1552123 RepID=A0A841ZWY0_9LIST|nr:DUF4097 family beta strand repeat-containing protein [Listeria booriae]MBC1565269.1 DUF4097 domain-containing protein [Listeria booriae]MBC1891252.1 DUF4097 domain-containing protein [Listeria booriae]